MSVKFKFKIGVLAIVGLLSGSALAQDALGYGQALGGRRGPSSVPGQLGEGATGQKPGISGKDILDSGMTNNMGNMGSAGVGPLYQIHILGQVRMPGTYRLPVSTRVAEAITMAGGVLPKGSTRRVELKRGGRIVKTYDLWKFYNEGQLSQNPFLLDNDEIFVPFADKVISVQGPVKRNGNMELVGANTLEDVVKLAGGYTVGIATSEPISVVRYQSGKKVVDKIPLTREMMDSFYVSDGDVIIFPHIQTTNRQYDYNVATLPNDNVYHPSLNDNIYIMGAVAQPGAYPFSAFMDARQYVFMAGPQRYAALGRMKLMSANGKSTKFKEGMTISPGDTIIVPYRAWTVDNVLKWYNTISSSIFTGYALNELVKSF